MSHLSGSGGQVIVTAIKGSEDPSDDLIVRAYETTGRPGRLVLDVALLDRRLEADFGANQIRTYRIPADSRRPVIEVDLLEWPLDEAGDDG